VSRSTASRTFAVSVRESMPSGRPRGNATPSGRL